MVCYSPSNFMDRGAYIWTASRVSHGSKQVNFISAAVYLERALWSHRLARRAPVGRLSNYCVSQQQKTRAYASGGAVPLCKSAP